MKVFLIDPHTRTITEQEHPGGLDSIYALLRCDTFEGVFLDKFTLYVDEEGLLKDLSAQAFFRITGKSDPLAGYAMVVGVDDAGNDTSPNTTLKELTAMVGWTTLEEIRERF